MRRVSYRPGGETMTPPAAVSTKAATRKASGRSIETLFDRTHETYRFRHQAVVMHLHPPVVGAPGNLRYAGDGHIDYVGAIGPRADWPLMVPGRTIAFDVKGCTGETALRVPKELPVTDKRHPASVRDRKRLMRQAELLLAIQRAGGLAAFLCVDTKRERCWIVSRPDLILAGEDVTFRHRDVDLFPSVAFSGVQQIAKGAPPIDYLRVWLGADG